MAHSVRPSGMVLVIVMTASLLGSGCMSAGCKTPDGCHEIIPAAVPKELSKVTMPAYVIEPPDILLIDAVKLIPKPPYRVQPLDALLIEGTNLLPTDPIAGVFGVDTDGSVNFGLVYGKVQVAGLTLEEAKAAIEKQLRTIVKKPDPTSPGPVVQVSLAATAGLQQIRGEHLVRPDGTVSLGTYGSVYVTGLTMSEAKAAIEAQLSTTLVRPEVVVDVFSYNSKVYYVITDNGGFGEQIIRLPITGNETVLDALANIGGLPATASKHRIWIARPSPSHGGGESCDDQILAVDYPAMTRCANTATNYQIFPGDRLYVQADPLIKLDGILTKIITPIERVLGFALFSDRAIIAIQNKNNGGNGGGAGLGGF